MQTLRFSLVSLSLIAMHQMANAAAYQLYELGTPIVATAGVGQAAVSEDASTSFFNPAGMSLLDKPQFLLGGQLAVPNIRFEQNANNTISGNNGGQIGALIPGIGSYFVYTGKSPWSFGVSLTSPYGGMLNYNDGWVGRYVVQGTTFYTLNFNPSVAYRVNDKFSVAAGVAAEYANLIQTVALPVTKLIDGQAKVTARDTSEGFNLGVMFKPFKTTKLGIAYRSEIKHNFEGNTSFIKFNQTPSTSTQLIMPQNVIVSLAQDIQKLTLLAEAGWSNWSAVQNITLNIRNVTATTTLNWKDTYRLGVGGQYHMSKAMLVQAGVSYDSSPTNITFRQPDLPMDKQLRAGTGVMMHVNEKAVVSFSYEFWKLGKAAINNTSSNGVLAGSYRKNHTNFIQVGINVTM